MSDAKKMPSHRVYTLIERQSDDAEDNKAFWLNIGSAWAHGDGKGFNLVLEALPLDGKLVLRELKEQEPEPPSRKGHSRK